MTPQERAEKITAEWIGYTNPNHFEIVNAIAAQIEEAEREAYEKTKATWKQIEQIAYKAGWNAAKEQAKGIAQALRIKGGDTEFAFGMGFAIKDIADRIGKMEPTNPPERGEK